MGFAKYHEDDLAIWQERIEKKRDNEREWNNSRPDAVEEGQKIYVSTAHFVLSST